MINFFISNSIYTTVLMPLSVLEVCFYFLQYSLFDLFYFYLTLLGLIFIRQDTMLYRKKKGHK